MEHFERLLMLCSAANATDLHLSTGSAPRLRIRGVLAPAPEEPPLTAVELHGLARGLANERQWASFQEKLTLDLARTGPDGSRYRINVYQERSGLAFAIRRLENTFLALEDWNLPAQLEEFTRLRDGLVLVTGPTGSGKTTTLATLLHIINREQALHILTIEDPIEYLHENLKALVTQRELHTSVPSFAEAVRAALREDPDVILVGEMRDTETMRTAITAAETGHLVFSTLHTGDAVGAVERMIGAFPADEQHSIRQQLSLALRAVVTQRLVPARNARGLAPAVEILKVTSAVANLIRSARSEQIYSVMEGSGALGMRTLDQELAALVVRGEVSEASARQVSQFPGALEQLLKRAKSG